MVKQVGVVGLAMVLTTAGAALAETAVEAPAEAAVEKAEKGQWLDSMPAALEKAKAERKSVLIDFTGSDWCPPCILLKEKVFTDPQFVSYASDRYVLLELDYPRDASKYSKEKQEANEALRVKYGIESFPTVLLMDSAGLPYGQVRGGAMDAAGYMPRLTEAEAALEKRNAAWKAAASAEGLGLAKALDSMLKTVPESLLPHYEEVIAKIIANDPEDTLGYAATVAKESLRLQQKAAFEKLGVAGRGKNKPDQVMEQLGLWQEFVKTPNLDKDIAQEAWYHMSGLYALIRDYDANLECLKKAYAANPDSEKAPRIKDWIDHNQKFQDEKKAKEQGEASQSQEPKE